MDIKEIERKIKILEDKIRIAEQRENAGLVLQKFDSGFSIYRDYDKVKNPRLKKLLRT